MTEPLTREELEQARFAKDHAGRPLMDQPRFRHDYFAAQVSRQRADEQAAAARPVPTPNAEALAELNRIQGWINPLTGRRAYEDPTIDGQAVREAIEEFRVLAMRGESIPAAVLADARERMAAAQAEADENFREGERKALEQYRLRERGY